MAQKVVSSSELNTLMKTKYQEGCEAESDPGEVPSSKKLWVAVEGGPPSSSFFCPVCRLSGLGPGQAQCVFSQDNCLQSINHALSECAQYGEDPSHTGSSEAFWTSISPPIITCVMTHILLSWDHQNTMKDHVPPSMGLTGVTEAHYVVI